MTPIQLDHLHRLKRQLENLLATAEKRTPGEWRADSARGVILESGSALTYPFGTPESEHNDAAFIASCAGNAEAGWKSTLVAIEALSEREAASCPFSKRLLESLLTAWPIEKLP